MSFVASRKAKLRRFQRTRLKIWFNSWRMRIWKQQQGHGVGQEDHGPTEQLRKQLSLSQAETKRYKNALLSQQKVFADMKREFDNLKIKQAATLLLSQGKTLIFKRRLSQAQVNVDEEKSKKETAEVAVEKYREAVEALMRGATILDGCHSRVVQSSMPDPPTEATATHNPAPTPANKDSDNLGTRDGNVDGEGGGGGDGADSKKTNRRRSSTNRRQVPKERKMKIARRATTASAREPRVPATFNEVQMWLIDMRLPGYLTSFEAAGYTSLEQVASMTEEHLRRDLQKPRVSEEHMPILLNAIGTLRAAIGVGAAGNTRDAPAATQSEIMSGALLQCLGSLGQVHHAETFDSASIRTLDAAIYDIDERQIEEMLSASQPQDADVINRKFKQLRESGDRLHELLESQSPRGAHGGGLERYHRVLTASGCVSVAHLAQMSDDEVRSLPGMDAEDVETLCAVVHKLQDQGEASNTRMVANTHGCTERRWVDVLSGLALSPSLNQLLELHLLPVVEGNTDEQWRSFFAAMSGITTISSMGASESPSSIVHVAPQSIIRRYSAKVVERVEEKLVDPKPRVLAKPRASSSTIPSMQPRINSPPIDTDIFRPNINSRRICGPDPRLQTFKRKVHEVPWAKYLDPPKNKQVNNKTAKSLAGMIAEIIARKIGADFSDDIEGREREDITSFVITYLKKKYGLMAMAEKHLYGIISAVRRYHNISSRIRIFGVICGISPVQHWTPKICDIYCALVGQLFPPEKVASALASGCNGVKGICFVSYDVAQAALDAVLPGSKEEVKKKAQDKLRRTGGTFAKVGGYMQVRDSLRLSKNVREKLLENVQSMRTPHNFIDVDEFLFVAMMAWKQQSEQHVEKLQTLFRAYDTNGNGQIEMDEFALMVRECTNTQMSRRSLERLFMQVSEKGDKDPTTVSEKDFNALAELCLSRNVIAMDGLNNREDSLVLLFADYLEGDSAPDLVVLANAATTINKFIRGFLARLHMKKVVSAICIINRTAKTAADRRMSKMIT